MLAPELLIAMNPLETRMTLLLRIRDSTDRNAWSEFFHLYTPLIYSYAIKHGLQDADAADLSQEVMCAVARSIHAFDYDPTRGSFRGWLVTIARNGILKRIEANNKQAVATGLSSSLALLDQVPSPESLNAWEHEYDLYLFHRAAEIVRLEFKQSTWDAFWWTTVDGKSIEEVAKSLAVSVGAVYISRSRVLARIRKTIAGFESLEREP